jgi:hypothetical protein
MCENAVKGKTAGYCFIVSRVKMSVEGDSPIFAA